MVSEQEPLQKTPTNNGSIMLTLTFLAGSDESLARAPADLHPEDNTFSPLFV